MPRREMILQVFVASPADVGEERAALEDIVRELNVTLSQALSVRLELIRWETHVVPGFGIDAQDVVNRQIANDYDIFIGIMWSRFGTPTDRGGTHPYHVVARSPGPLTFIESIFRAVIRLPRLEPGTPD